jgi:hypothetical protein
VRCVLVVLCALALDASLLERARAAQVCAWIVESVADDGAHRFDLNLGADKVTWVAARFQGPGVTSGSMGGGLIQLSPGAPQDVDNVGFDVSAGDDLDFNVQLFNHALESLDEVTNPTQTPLANFTFHRKVGQGEAAPPVSLANKQCKPLD